MANQYTLDNDFAAIAEPQGTLYNVGDSAIELADADTTPKGQGILLLTGERRTFSGTLYARSMDASATLNVSDFTETAGGGGGGSYVLPIATASKLGGVKVGSNLSIDADGVLSATGGGGYVLPEATASTLGGVIIGDNVNVEADGTISVPVGTTSAKGVLQVGTGLAVADGVVSVDISDATASTKGVVKIGDNINVSSGTISVPVATTSTLGVVSVGTGLSVDGSGVLSAAGYTLPEATASTLGGVIIGDNIDVSLGVISVPKATSSTLGVVKPGAGLSVDSDGILSAAGYTLPIASAAVLGGVKVGTGLIIDADTGVLSSTGGSALLPHIIVTAPTGCAVTVRHGSTTLTATESSGTWDFEVPSLGSWIVKCEKPGDSTIYTEKTVLVSEITGYLVGMDYAYRYGYKIKKTESNPSTRVEYTHMAVGMTPAQMDFTTGIFDYGDWGDVWFVKNNKPCMLKSDGTVDYYLDPNNYAYKADGVTASDVANTSYDGNAMSEIPLVWVCRTEDSEYLYETVCDVQYDSSYKAFAHTKADGTIANAFYLGMFGGSGDSTKIRSLSGQSLARRLTRQQECDACAANGAGWYTQTWSQRSLIRTLLVLLGKSTNTQAVYGNGNIQGSSGAESSMLTTGTLNDKGQFFGSNGVTTQVKAFHCEKLWGDQGEAIAGLIGNNGPIYVKMTPEGAGYKINDVTGYTNTGITPSGTNGGFWSAAHADEAGIIVSDLSGTSSTYYCDTGFINNTVVSYLLVGSDVSDNVVNGGIFCQAYDSLATRTSWYFGARPSYV